MSRLNGEAGFWDMSIPLIWRGVGLAFLTVPLTALAVSGLDAKDIPQGSAINNMMRQLGGSFGIAIVNTFLLNKTAQHRNDLLSNINLYNDALQNRYDTYKQFMLSAGSSQSEAELKAAQLINANVVQQSSMLSYMDAYLLIGLIFLLSMPLLLTAKRNKKQPVIVMMDH